MSILQTWSLFFKYHHYYDGSRVCYNQGPDFDDMSSCYPCEIDDAIQYINLEYGAQAPKIVIL